MQYFEQTLALLGFGNSASTAFDNQACNHSSLSKQDGCYGNDLPTIPLPHVGLAKLHDTVGWQAAFADIPVTQCAPVVHRRAENYVRRSDSRRFFAFQNTKCHFGTLRT